MQELAHRPRYDFAQYLELEASSSTKHEFFGGDIFAMAGGTPDHAARSVAVSSALHAQLRGRACRVFSSDLRVRVARTGLTTYPDVTVVCGPLETDPQSDTTVVNPTVVVEVLSESTARYDRGDKLEHYKQIPSLQACVLVAHDEPLVEVYVREGEDWRRYSWRSGESARIPAIDCVLAVDDIAA